MTSPELSEVTTIPGAVEHAVMWFDIEEETYASINKFGYQRILDYFRESGFEPGSVLESQFTTYWSRGVDLDNQFRRYGEDTLAARQYFAKHTNASRATLSTIMACIQGGDYTKGKLDVRDIMSQHAVTLEDQGLPFTDGGSFDAYEFFETTLNPTLLEINQLARGSEPENIPWAEAATAESEQERLRQLIAPITNYLLASLGVTVAYVINDGPLPQPGLPSGEVRQWTTLE